MSIIIIYTTELFKKFAKAKKNQIPPSQFLGEFKVTCITPSHSHDPEGVISKRQTWQECFPLLLATDACKYLTLQRFSLTESAT